ncbi:hypothetical protein [Streptomyces sp. NPDC050738]|uniref:hypothetical protein n=1 Tax=Streptomyces sp. NPDC050738 TaxID=3154744 RepID=UPI0034437FFE
MREAITLGLRGNKAHQIRYLLARATTYADEACKKPFDILAYLDRDQFHIEHLWANHHHRVAGDLPDPVVFRSRRNQLGGLGLLRGRENSSIDDLPFHDKNRLWHIEDENGVRVSLRTIRDRAVVAARPPARQVR